MPIIISNSPVTTQNERLIAQNTEFVITPALKNKNVGQGTLFVCEDKLCWNDGHVYISIDYPTIIIHAISRDTENGSANIYCQLSSGVYVDEDGVLLQSEVTEDDDLIPVEIRIIPQDSGIVGQIYEIISECQKLNPDPIEDGGDWITESNVNSFIPTPNEQVFSFN